MYASVIFSASLPGLLRRAFFVIVMLLLAEGLSAQNKASFTNFLKGFAPAALPYSPGSRMGEAIAEELAETFLGQIQGEEYAYDFSNAFYVEKLPPQKAYTALIVFNALVWEEEESFEEVYYLCTFSPQGQFIDCLALQVNLQRSIPENQTRHLENVEGRIDASGLIRLSIHITDEYTEEQSGEVVRSEAKESKKYRLLANGKIKEIE
jgi:hypothetical protein